MLGFTKPTPLLRVAAGTTVAAAVIAGIAGASFARWRRKKNPKDHGELIDRAVIAVTTNIDNTQEKLVDPLLIAVSVFASERSGDQSAVEVFWFSARWRRSYGNCPPDAIEALVKEFLDEPAGWRRMLVSATDILKTLLEFPEGSITDREVKKKMRNLMCVLQHILERLDDCFWLVGRERLLTKLVWRVDELMFRFTSVATPVRADVVEPVLVMAQCACEELWDERDYFGGGRPRRHGSRIARDATMMRVGL